MNRRLLMILALTMSFSAMADDKDNSTYKLGDEVRAWTDLQKSGQASDSKVQAMPGEIADKVYERYQKTFETPIPETFSRESFVGGSGGGGSGGQ